MDNSILKDLSYGVYIVGTKDDNKNVGCVINSAVQITSKPATIAVSINHDNYTNKCIKKRNKFSLSILNEKNDASIIGTFGFSSSKDTDKYKDIDYKIVDDCPVLNSANGYVVCDVVATLETDTHTIFLGKVITEERTNDEKPMTYKFYHEVLKGKSPEKAPTYVEDLESEITGSRWRCTLCGYIYEGDDLPLDYVCPICRQPREVFEKID